MIEGLGPAGVRIAGTDHALPALVLRDRVLPLAGASLERIALTDLAPALEAGIRFLLIGCGARAGLLPPTLRAALHAAGLGVETMATGAACRTYNILLQEGRLVAALLLP